MGVKGKNNLWLMK